MYVCISDSSSRTWVLLCGWRRQEWSVWRRSRTSHSLAALRFEMKVSSVEKWCTYPIDLESPLLELTLILIPGTNTSIWNPPGFVNCPLLCCSPFLKVIICLLLASILWFVCASSPALLETHFYVLFSICLRSEFSWQSWCLSPPSSGWSLMFFRHSLVAGVHSSQLEKSRRRSHVYNYCVKS